MTIALRSADSVTAHAVCMAAGIRDGLRTAQYYVRDLSKADGHANDMATHPTFLSRLVASLARGMDRLLSHAADISVRLFVPKWRDLPSPFAPGMRGEVIEAIRQNRLVLTSLFTAYFFRAAKHILENGTDGPFLVLEHRIDAARRLMAENPSTPGEEPTTVLARALLNLVEADTVARSGKVKPQFAFLQGEDPNLAVMAAACVALLIAEEGKPIESLNEDEFFAIAGALLAPRLPDMQVALRERDINALAQVLKAVRDLY
jgi:hypothetical protein